MNKVSGLEEQLREASCIGDIDSVLSLLNSNVDVNGKNLVNGWTPLHWAVKRGNKKIVSLLLDAGADKTIEALDGTLPSMLSNDPEICKLLDSEGLSEYKGDSLVITPNYLQNPPLCPKVANVKHTRQLQSLFSKNDEELVLKIRIADVEDKDFIEIEIPLDDLTYNRLQQICKDELGITQQPIKIRKLPNTIIRKDKDVRRLQNFQELELIIKHPD